MGPLVYIDLLLIFRVHSHTDKVTFPPQYDRQPSLQLSAADTHARNHILSYNMG